MKVAITNDVNNGQIPASESRWRPHAPVARVVSERINIPWHNALLRDRLLARLASGPPDYQRLACDVLGILGAAPALARTLVEQALVFEDRREHWRRVGERARRDAPAAPGVYVFRDWSGTVLYVGKAANLRRRLSAHFATRRWRVLPPALAGVAAIEWQQV